MGNEGDEDGELGDFGEEIIDMNDVPIERPKCLSNINFNSVSDKQAQTNNNAQTSATSGKEIGQNVIQKLRKIQSSISRGGETEATPQSINTEVRMNLAEVVPKTAAQMQLDNSSYFPSYQQTVTQQNTQGQNYTSLENVEEIKDD